MQSEKVPGGVSCLEVREQTFACLFSIDFSAQTISQRHNPITIRRVLVVCVFPGQTEIDLLMTQVVNRPSNVESPFRRAIRAIYFGHLSSL
jgi:hypothetical protein